MLLITLLYRLGYDGYRDSAVHPKRQSVVFSKTNSSRSASVVAAAWPRFGSCVARNQTDSKACWRWRR